MPETCSGKAKDSAAPAAAPKAALTPEKSPSPEALLLGLAVGDALGVPVEFKRRGSFHVDGMTGYGTHHQPPGTWSDDTSMALALADALAPDDLNLDGIARNFIEWHDAGAYTAHGETFDVGGATHRAIGRLKKGTRPEQAGGQQERDNGNGSLMRIAPLLFYLSDKPVLERYEITRKVSSITHAHPVSVTACFIFIEFLRLLTLEASKAQAYALLKNEFADYRNFLDREALARFDRILAGDISLLEECAIKSSGYVVDTLEAAIWSFLTTDSYGSAVLMAVNLGEDTDTVGAVTGAMAGLYYGLNAIPRDWLEALAKRREIGEIAKKLQF